MSAAADPTAAIERRLRTRALGRPLIWVPRLDSTMDEARRRVDDAGPGTAILAGEQSRGRGRRGRVFVSPPGGLYLSVILEPLPEPHHSWRLGFALALAARRAVMAAGGPALSFKWPNDLLRGQRKVGGVLLELLTPAGGAARVIAGIGLNLGPDPSRLDAAARGAGAVSLPGSSAEALAMVAAELLEAFEARTRLLLDGGWPQILGEVRACIVPRVGGRITVRTPAGDLLRGDFVDLAADGALVLRDLDSGEVRALRHGEIASIDGGGAGGARGLESGGGKGQDRAQW
ncbi:MAG: biotin--[acetyl-CoA-carboxylase] ligase [Acidobacteriota bacterium]|nr:biotin--[acetyl-CoA-carboxylase] ligase [Acidobacteriota bacterium]MDQ7086730.1 biotin--[acetyl-CoA-carboxylase] ligase [Acidobacteriota bacterium]